MEIWTLFWQTLGNQIYTCLSQTWFSMLHLYWLSAIFNRGTKEVYSLLSDKVTTNDVLEGSQCSAKFWTGHVERNEHKTRKNMLHLNSLVIQITHHFYTLQTTLTCRIYCANHNETMRKGNILIDTDKQWNSCSESKGMFKVRN